jgi:hypothetical protein
MQQAQRCNVLGTALTHGAGHGDPILPRRVCRSPGRWMASSGTPPN